MSQRWTSPSNPFQTATSFSRTDPYRSSHIGLLPQEALCPPTAHELAGKSSQLYVPAVIELDLTD